MPSHYEISEGGCMTAVRKNLFAMLNPSKDGFCIGGVCPCFRGNTFIQEDV